MKKGKITQYALFFVVCMTLSLVTGITAKADDNPPVGFYYSTDPEDMVETITTSDGDNVNVFHSCGDVKEFYLYLDAGDGNDIEFLSESNEPNEENKWWGEPKALNIMPWKEGVSEIYKDLSELGEYISVEEVENEDGWYKITLTDPEGDYNGLGLEVRAVVTDSEGGSWIETGYVTIRYHESLCLYLLNKDNPEDFDNWLGGAPKEPVEFQLQEVENEDGKIKLSEVTDINDIDVLKATWTDDMNEGEEHIAKADSADYTLTYQDNSFTFESNKEGKYYLVKKGSYIVEDRELNEPTELPKNPIQIDVWQPQSHVGFYYSLDPDDRVETIETSEGDVVNVFRSYDDVKEFYLYLDAGDGNSIEFLSASNEPKEENKWWGEAKALNIGPWEEGVSEIYKNIDETNEYILVEEVAGEDGWYKITLADPEGNYDGLGLEVRAVVTDSDGNSWVDGNYIEVRYNDSTEEDSTEIAFYSLPELSEDNLIGNNDVTFDFYSGALNEFYLYLDNTDDNYTLTLADGEDNSDAEGTVYPFTVYSHADWENPVRGKSSGVDNYISVTPVDGKDGWYKIKIDPTETGNFAPNFTIQARAWKEHKEDSEDACPLDSWIDIINCPVGLVAAMRDNPDELGLEVWGDVYPRTIVFSLNNVTVLETENGSTCKPLTNLDLSKITIQRVNWGGENEDVDKSSYDIKIVESKYISLAFKEYGTYVLTYDGIAGEIQVDSYLPVMGFYSTAIRSDDDMTNFLGYEISYKEAQPSTIYMLSWLDEEENRSPLYPDTIKINAYSENGSPLSGYITTEKLETGNYKITTTNKATGTFKVVVTATENWEPDDPNCEEIISSEIQFNCTPVTKLQVKTAPTKTVYTEGETFDKTGMVVEAVYSDESTYPVTDYTVSPSTALTTANNEVTISFNGKTIKQTITVNAAAVTEPKPEPAPTPAPTPTPTPTPTPEPTPTVKVGDTTVSSDSTYRVTSSDSNKKEVAYVSGDKKAKKVTIPSAVTVDGVSYSVTEIASSAFSGNKKMTSVTIPSTVVKIGDNAFKNCTKLKKVTIPENVTTIGKNAFSGCKQAKTITIKSKNISKIGKDAFKGVSKNATIKVPKSKKKAYTKLLKKAGFRGKIK